MDKRADSRNARIILTVVIAVGMFLFIMYYFFIHEEPCPEFNLEFAENGSEFRDDGFLISYVLTAGQNNESESVWLVNRVQLSPYNPTDGGISYRLPTDIQEFPATTLFVDDIITFNHTYENAIIEGVTVAEHEMFFYHEERTKCEQSRKVTIKQIETTNTNLNGGEIDEQETVLARSGVPDSESNADCYDNVCIMVSTV